MKLWSAVVGMGMLAFALNGCAYGAEWKGATVAPTYVAPKKLTVLIKMTATGEDIDKAAEALAKSLTEELKEKGIIATIVKAPASPPSATLDITSWEAGSRMGRWFAGGFGAGHGEVVVHVEVSPSAETAGAFTGDIRGFVRGGMFGGESTLSAESAGKKIADAIATGKTKDE